MSRRLPLHRGGTGTLGKCLFGEFCPRTRTTILNSNCAYAVQTHSNKSCHIQTTFPLSVLRFPPHVRNDPGLCEKRSCQANFKHIANSSPRGMHPTAIHRDVVAGLGICLHS